MSTFLIVDDSKMMNSALTGFLREDDHDVAQVYTLEDAINSVKEKEYDYILLDLILPDGDGEMLLPFVQNTPTKVIVLTTDRDSFRREKIFSFGIVDYIIKDKIFNEITTEIKSLYTKIESNKEYTILVVDDSNFIRKHIVQMLQKRGINTVEATNGKEALSLLLSRQHVDMAIIDLEMPEIDGLTLLNKIKKNIYTENLPVMILTGSNDANVIAKVIKSGVWDFSKKPYIIEELLLKVDSILDRLKQSRLIEKHRLQFGMYFDAMKTSTLFLRLNTDFTIQYMNKLLKQLLQVETPPSTLQDIIDEEDKILLNELQKKMQQEVPFKKDFKLKYKGEYKGYISATFSPITSKDDTLEEILMIAQDITPIHEYQSKLNQQVKEQAAVNLNQKNLMFQQAKMAAMGEMIGNIAHQWRQPLNAIALLIQDLTDAYEFDELDEKYINDMVEKSMTQINFMSKTIDDFRNFFQPNKLKQRFDILEAIGQTIEIVRPTLQTKNITLKIKNRTEKQVILNNYLNELQQVILNLINNAKDALLEKYKDTPSHEKFIIISIEEDDKKITISVSDNGGGIPENIIERIFEPYFTTKEEGKGTGVGLYMSKMIIEQNLHGILNVKNTSEGALFSIILPRTNSETTDTGTKL